MLYVWKSAYKLVENYNGQRHILDIKECAWDPKHYDSNTRNNYYRCVFVSSSVIGTCPKLTYITKTCQGRVHSLGEGTLAGKQTSSPVWHQSDHHRSHLGKGEGNLDTRVLEPVNGMQAWITKESLLIVPASIPRTEQCAAFLDYWPFNAVLTCG